MIRQRRHPAATQSTTRLEAFTDGVFAIAATLLVLDLTTHSIGKVDTDVELWTALGGMWELFFNFGVSFGLLCMMWMIHVRQFEHIARVDAVMLWLNNGRLLFVVLVPFATALTTEYSEFLAARLAMPVVFFLVILCSWMQWNWATSHQATMIPDLTAVDATANGRGALSALIIAAAVVALAPFVGSIAFVLFVFDGPLTRLLGGRK